MLISVTPVATDCAPEYRLMNNIHFPLEMNDVCYNKMECKFCGCPLR